ncbi:hypothetical protein, partial [Streptomyces albidoflavus]
RDLAVYTRALDWALKADRAFPVEAGAASARARRFLRCSGDERALRAVILMLLAARSVHELADLAYPATGRSRFTHR